MKKSLLFIIVFVLCLSACGKQSANQSDNLMSELQDTAVESDYYTNESPEVVAFQQEMEKAYGEVWHSDNYNKDEIEIPSVTAEETVTGENWFPPINNSAPIDEIAPTISYDLMVDGYGVCDRYPSDPSKFTPEYLNENAFPIAFFRKVNDLCYYTVCKVEGGGYMYYFFCANNNISYEDAMNSIGFKVDYDESGAVVQDIDMAMKEYLFNDEYADISKMDLTKEVVWRGSVYAVADLGDQGDLRSAYESIPFSITGGKWRSRTAKAASEVISKSLLPAETVQRRMAENINTEHPENITYGYYLLQQLGRHCYGYGFPIMVEDRIMTVAFMIESFDFNEFDFDMNYSPKYQTMTVSGFGGNGSSDNSYLGCRYEANIGPKIGEPIIKSEQVTVYNSFPVNLLPGDNVYELES